MLEKHPWNSFLLCLVVEILQLVHKIAVSPGRYLKEVFWKTSQNSQINRRSSHPKVFCQRKYVTKHLAKFSAKHLFRSLFLNKFASWKPDTIRSSDCRCSVKQGALKNFANFTGNNLCWILFLRKLDTWCLQLNQRRLRQRCFPEKNCNYFEENLCMSTCKLSFKRDSKVGVSFKILWII